MSGGHRSSTTAPPSDITEDRRQVRGRLTSLDGLRGIAALAVVVHHALLTQMPVHLFWLGPAAVYVFFVLSGFVLSLPFLRATPTPWRSYYPARLVRLYLPVWAAVAFATVLIIAVPRDAQPGQSWWVVAHDGALNLRTLFNDATLLEPTYNNSPLWSLKYEVAFSLLLPVYLAIASRLRGPRAGASAAVGALATCGVGSLMDSPWLTFMPMFAVGVLMGVHRRDLVEIASRTTPWAWAAIIGVAGLLLWMPIDASESTPGVLLGAALMVFAFLGCPGAVRIAKIRVVQLLGTLSFSLYLVHEPIVVTIAVLWSDAPRFGVLLIALPVSLGVAWIFYKLVESPSHRLSKTVGRLAGGVVRA